MNLYVDARMIGYSGIGTYLVNTLKHLASSESVKITLLGDSDKAKKHDWTRRGNVRVLDFKAPIYSVREQAELFFHASPRADIFWSPHFNVPVISRSRRLVVTIHDVCPLNFKEQLSSRKALLYANYMFRKAAESASLVITDSVFSKEEIVRHTGVSGDKIRVVHLGVPEAYRPALPGDTARIKEKYCKGHDYLLFVGNLKPNKNLRRLIEAFSAAVKTGLREKLLIVGKAGGRALKSEGLTDLVSSLGLTDKVLFSGYVPDEDMPAVYTAARALAMPSLYEGFGLPPLEAMACGTPAIAADAASLPEVCGDAALYCDPYDVFDIAEKIEAIVSDEGLRESLRKKGFARASLFTYDKTARGVMETFREAIQS